MYAEKSFFGDLLAPGGQARLRSEGETFVNTLSNHKKRSARYLPTDTASDGDEQSQAVKAELAGKFATVAGRLGNGFLRDNFDHLTDVDDIELLMQEPEAFPSASELNREATHVLQPQTSIVLSGKTSSSGIMVPSHSKATNSALLPSLPLPPSPRLPAVALDTNAIRATSVQNGRLSQGEESSERMVLSESLEKPFLAGQSFYFCVDVREDVKEWLGRIHQAGAIMVCGGHAQASKETAITHAQLVITESRDSWEYQRVSSIHVRTVFCSTMSRAARHLRAPKQSAI